MPKAPTNKTLYADDDTTPVGLLLRLRIPPLIIGLVLGFGISILTSRFEEVLTNNVYVAFFIPFVVYIAAAVGNQTHSIYSRDLTNEHTKFHNYLIKESLLGVVLGTIFGLISWFIIDLWLHDEQLALAVGISLCISVAIAPILAIAITKILHDLHKDPAVATAPISTAIQDIMTIVIYGMVTSFILL